MKDIIRKKYLHIRKNIKNKKYKSHQIFLKIINEDSYKNALVIGLYSNLSDEVSTKELIDYSFSIGKIIALPKVEDDVINFYKIDKDETLLNGKYSIKEPNGKKENYLSKDKLDLIIVPGICFNKSGYRIGFGKGYYDKYLENNLVSTIGVCYKELLVDLEFNEYHDQKVNKVITD